MRKLNMGVYCISLYFCIYLKIPIMKRLKRRRKRKRKGKRQRRKARKNLKKSGRKERREGGREGGKEEAHHISSGTGKGRVSILSTGGFSTNKANKSPCSRISPLKVLFLKLRDFSQISNFLNYMASDTLLC